MSGTGSFTQKLITVMITAGTGTDGSAPPTFGANNSSQLILEGHRVACSITQAGTIAQGQASIIIWGMLQSDMDALASIAQPYYASNGNTVTVLAGDSENGMQEVFTGVLNSALPNFAEIPDVSFEIMAVQQFAAAMASTPPVSYPGTVPVSKMLGQVAQGIGLRLENNGVTATLSDHYLAGSPLDQIQDVCEASNTSYIIENNVLAIWPQGQYRSTQQNPPTISKNTGLVGYPEYTNFGINFKKILDPSIKFAQNIVMQSDLKKPSGTWTVYNIAHQFESQIEDGEWFSYFQCCKPGYMPIVTS